MGSVPVTLPMVEKSVTNQSTVLHVDLVHRIFFAIQGLLGLRDTIRLAVELEHEGNVLRLVVELDLEGIIRVVVELELEVNISLVVVQEPEVNIRRVVELELEDMIRLGVVLHSVELRPVHVAVVRCQL